MKVEFSFETMDAYRLAVKVARWVRRADWPDRHAHLKDQATRASESMVLNLAEGRLRGGKAGKNQIRIAHGSAGEVCAVLDLVELEEGPEHQRFLRRVGMMLSRMK